MHRAIPVILDASVRSAVLLVVIMAAAWLWRRGPASSRHLLWLLGVGGMLLMPFIVRATPAWLVARTAVDIPLIDASVPTAMHSERVLMLVRAAPATAGTPTSPSTTERVRRESRILPAIWLGGVLAVGCWLSLGWLSVYRLRRRARRIRDALLLEAAEDACRAIGLPRLPRLFMTEGISVPLVCGWIRTDVLLPSAVYGWSPEELRVALLHEFAHIRRRDGIGQLISAFAITLYWFHPGAWVASKALAAECEAASDEMVLRAGVDPMAYAHQLLDLARRVGNRATPFATMAMARPRGLERRLRSVLRWRSHDRSRDHVRRIAAALGIVALAASLGAMKAAAPSAVVEAATASSSARKTEGEVSNRTASRDSGTSIRPSAWKGPAIQAGVSEAPPNRVGRPGNVPYSDGITRLHVTARKGVCGFGVPNEITFSRGVPTGGFADCQSSPAVIELRMRNGQLSDVASTVGGDGSSAGDAGSPELATWLLDAAPSLPPEASARAVQAAALIDGADVANRLLRLARDPALEAAAQRMSVIWADIVGGADARDELLSILRDESLSLSLREQAVVALGSYAWDTALELARRSPNVLMRQAAAHRLGLALPVDVLLALYPTFPDAASRRGLADRIAERGSAAQREQFAAALEKEPDDALRASASARVRRP